MAQRRRAHRSHVSYIDKSREYYAAQGYPEPYGWACNGDAPFAPLPKPLAECRVGVVTTSYFLPKDFVYQQPGDLPGVSMAAGRVDVDRLDNQHLSWAKDETHTEDPDSFLPLRRLDEMAAAGSIGSVSDRFYCLPTQYSHRRTQRIDAPKILEWFGEDEVDVALMVPL